MKFYLFFILSLLITLNVAGQSVSDFFSFENSPKNFITKAELKKPQDVELADLDGDGYQDIIVVSEKDHKLSLYRNLGNGDFSEQIVINTEIIGASDIAISDADKDGDKDIFVTAPWIDQVFIFQNKGGFNFDPINEPLIAGNHVRALVFSDLDNDGDDDLLSASHFDNEVVWHENLGNLNFTDSQAIADSIELVNVLSVADFDNDGLNDVLATTSMKSFHSIYIIKNLGNGDFSEPRIITDRTYRFGKEIQILDFDGDSDLDFIAISAVNGGGITIHVFVNIGSMTFSIENLLSLDSFSIYGYDVPIKLSDFDDDGDLDIGWNHFAPNYEENRSYNVLQWLENLGDGYNYEVTEFRTNHTSDFQVADIDLDGKNDIVYVEGGVGSISWLKKTGENEYIDKTINKTSPYCNTSYYYQAQLDDIDNDGDFDVVCQNNGRHIGPNFTFYENLSNGEYKIHNADSLIINQHRRSILTDVDGDGDKDLLFTSYYHVVGWAEQIDDFVFKKVESLTNDDAFSYRPTFSDVNQDGFVDVIYEGRNRVADRQAEWELSYFENNSGLFSKKIIAQIWSENSTDDIKYALNDIDNDNDIDAVFTLPETKVLYVATNDGNQNFTISEYELPEQWDYLYNQSSIEIRDLDNNYYPELIFRNQKNWRHEWMNFDIIQNFGEESFDLNEVHHLELKHGTHRYVDINQDGLLDIMVHYYYSNGDPFELTTYINDGLFGFEAIDSLETNFNATSYNYNFIDIDNDGDLDFFSQTGYREMYWIENIIGNKVNTDITGASNPETSKLYPNYPNPFNPTTNFVFELKQAESIEFKIFDITGRLVSIIDQRNYSEGRNEVVFNASSLSSGVYFYKMIGNNFIETSRFTIIK